MTWRRYSWAAVLSKGQNIITLVMTASLAFILWVTASFGGSACYFTGAGRMLAREQDDGLVGLVGTPPAIYWGQGWPGGVFFARKMSVFQRLGSVWVLLGLKPSAGDGLGRRCPRTRRRGARLLPGEAGADRPPPALSDLP